MTLASMARPSSPSGPALMHVLTTRSSTRRITSASRKHPCRALGTSSGLAPRHPAPAGRATCTRGRGEPRRRATARTGHRSSRLQQHANERLGVDQGPLAEDLASRNDHAIVWLPGRMGELAPHEVRDRRTHLGRGHRQVVEKLDALVAGSQPVHVPGVLVAPGRPGEVPVPGASVLLRGRPVLQVVSTGAVDPRSGFHGQQPCAFAVALGPVALRTRGAITCWPDDAVRRKLIKAATSTAGCGRPCTTSGCRLSFGTSDPGPSLTSSDPYGLTVWDDRRDGR